MMHFQLMHESLARFSEDFASFLYGLNMNAFCVDFPEGPLTESFKRMREKEEREGVAANGGGGMGQGQQGQHGQNMGGATTTVKTEREGFDGETTFMFVSLCLSVCTYYRMTTVADICFSCATTGPPILPSSITRLQTSPVLHRENHRSHRRRPLQGSQESLRRRERQEARADEVLAVVLRPVPERRAAARLLGVHRTGELVEGV